MTWATTTYLVLIGIGVLAFLLSKHIQKWMVIIAKVLFLVCVIGSLISVFTVKPFVYFAERSLKNAGTLETLQKIDKTLPVSKVIVPVKNIIDSIKSLWKPQETQDIVVAPTTKEVGILEAEVYPNVVIVTARVYKSTAMLFFLAGLLLSIYMQYSLVGISELEALKKNYELLEKKVELMHGQEK